MMGIDMDIIMHFNVTMPDGSEEVALQWMFKSYQWNVTFVVDELIFHVVLQRGYVPEIQKLTCNFCDEFPLDVELYKQVFNTVLLPPTTVLEHFFNPILMTRPIPWPAEIMNIGQFSDIEISFGNNFIYMGSGITWVPFPIPEKGLAKKIWPEPTIKERKKNTHIGKQ
jgi:hypothetical protein